MLGFVSRRLLYLVPVLIAVSLLTFLVAALLPGDLAVAMLADEATPERVAALRSEMGLDRPLAAHRREGAVGDPPTSAGDPRADAVRSADRPCDRRAARHLVRGPQWQRRRPRDDCDRLRQAVSTGIHAGDRADL